MTTRFFCSDAVLRREWTAACSLNTWNCSKSSETGSFGAGILPVSPEDFFHIDEELRSRKIDRQSFA